VYTFTTSNYTFADVQSALSSHDNEVYLGEGTFLIPYLGGANTGFSVYASVFQGAGPDRTFLRTQFPLEVGSVIMRTYGSDIHISGFTFADAQVGVIAKGKFPDGTLTYYNNVVIDSVTFDGMTEWTGLYENSVGPGADERTVPALYVNNALLKDSYPFGKSDVNMQWTTQSPFIGMDHVTFDNLQGTVAADILVVETAPGQYETRGDDFLTNIAIETGKTLIKKELWPYTSTTAPLSHGSPGTQDLS